MSHGGDIYSNKVNIDFSVNLNPMGVPLEVKNSLISAMNNISNYPDITHKGLRESLADLYNISVNQVAAGNGASELIMAIVRAINPRKVLLVEPGFSGYRFAIDSLQKDCEIIEHELSEDKGFCLDETILDKVTKDIDMLILTNPMNPIGQNISEDLIGRILEKACAMDIEVLLDESFYELSSAYGSSKKDRYRDILDMYPNTWILKSFTKLFAIPGVRIGFLLAKQDRISKVYKLLPEWNVSVLADAAGMECIKLLKEGDYLKKSQELIELNRAYLISGLKAAGYTVYGSDTVFVYLLGESGLYEKLLDQGILIRRGVGLDNYYRIAVKTLADIDMLLKRL